MGSFTTSEWLLLTVAPFINKGLTSWHYAMVTLHFRRFDWPLWQFGLTSLLGFSNRANVNACIARAGPWFIALTSVLQSCCLVGSAVFPNNKVAVITAVCGYIAFDGDMALTGLCHCLFCNTPNLQKASRLQNLSATVGYAMAPFVSGVLFDLSGWQAVSIFGLAVSSILSATLFFSPPIRKNFRRWMAARNLPEGQDHDRDGDPDCAAATPADGSPAASTPLPEKGSTSAVAMVALHEGAEPASHPPTPPTLPNPPTQDQDHWPETGVDIDIDVDSRSGSGKAGPKPKLAWLQLMAGVAPALTAGANMGSYNIEWATFAIYFRDEHNWTNASAAGFFQMIGDVVGAAVLFAIALGRCRHSRSESEVVVEMTGSALHPCLRLVSNVFGHPFNLTWLLLIWCMLNMGMTMPSLIAAITSQTLMGTAYTTTLQMCNEANLRTAGEDLELFMRLQFMNFSSQAVLGAAALGSAVVLYEEAGPNAPFYTAAALCCTCACLNLLNYALLRWFSGQGQRKQEQSNVLCPGEHQARGPVNEVTSGSCGHVAWEFEGEMEIGLEFDI